MNDGEVIVERDVFVDFRVPFALGDDVRGGRGARLADAALCMRICMRDHQSCAWRVSVCECV